jgi:hypothetical protein
MATILHVVNTNLASIFKEKIEYELHIPGVSIVAEVQTLRKNVPSIMVGYLSANL